MRTSGIEYLLKRKKDKFQLMAELEAAAHALMVETGDANGVRRIVEDKLVQLDPTQANYKKLQDQFRHCFIEESTASPVALAYTDVYIGNLIDAARGKQ